MVNGRNKGRRGELEVAHIIREWWAKHEASALFIRTPLSGGWASNTKAAAHFRASGDLMTTSSDFPFCVEVKWRETWSVDYFLDGKRSVVWSWWVQAITAAEKQDEIPMLWLRKNRIKHRKEPFPWIVVVPQAYALQMKLDSPDIRWAPSTFAIRDIYLSQHPCAYEFTRFLTMDPVRMVGKRRSIHT